MPPRAGVLDEDGGLLAGGCASCRVPSLLRHWLGQGPRGGLLSWRRRRAWSSQRGHGREARPPRLLPPGTARLPLRGPEVLIRRRLRPTWTEHTGTWSTTIAGAAMSGALHGLKRSGSCIVQ